MEARKTRNTAAGHDLSAEVALVGARFRAEAFAKALERYPSTIESTMPTMLGNTLRRHEQMAGRPYGFWAPTVVPHLMFVADRQLIDYVDDTRSGMDLSVRFVVAWLEVAVITFLLLWPYGPWLALPLAAYGMAWISYRGAVRSAEDYGVALLLLLDFGHGKLHDYFAHLVANQDARAETATAISALRQRVEIPSR
jgi:hypothetical protein